MYSFKFSVLEDKTDLGYQRVTQYCEIGVLMFLELAFKSVSLLEEPSERNALGNLNSN